MLSTVANSKDTNDFLKNFVLFLIVLIVSMFFLQFLWNKSLVPHITVLRPLTSLTDAFLMALALNLLR
jgi:hypothetical protein